MYIIYCNKNILINMTFFNAIGIGIGIVIGVTLSIILLTIIISKSIKKYKYKEKKFTVPMFIEYRKKLIENEDYEELKKIDSIIISLENKEENNLLNEYDIETSSKIILNENNDGGMFIDVKKTQKIIHKKYKDKNE